MTRWSKVRLRNNCGWGIIVQSSRKTPTDRIVPKPRMADWGEIDDRRAAFHTNGTEFVTGKDSPLHFSDGQFTVVCALDQAAGFGGDFGKDFGETFFRTGTRSPSGSIDGDSEMDPFLRREDQGCFIPDRSEERMLNQCPGTSCRMIS